MPEVGLEPTQGFPEGFLRPPRLPIPPPGPKYVHRYYSSLTLACLAKEKVLSKGSRKKWIFFEFLGKLGLLTMSGKNERRRVKLAFEAL